MTDHTRDIESRESRLQRHLQELIDAIDHRVAQIEREGESQIAAEAKTLREMAQKRLTQLATRV